MSAPTIMEQALLSYPKTAAPPAYNGVGWLVVLNMGTMTACMWVGAMAAIMGCASGLWRHRGDKQQRVANLLRTIGLLALICFTLRSAGEVMQLWGWNPDDVKTTAWVRTAKHYLDPFAVSFGLAAIALATLSWETLMAQMTREPLPPHLWTSLPKLKRPAMIVACAFLAAAGVVATR